MKKFIRISIWAFFLTLFSACTLMLDEPENVGEEVPEQNGDGWESPRTETEDMGSVTYQFTKTTVYLDESYRQYIIKADCDTASKHIDIYMKKSTPKDLIPQRGTTLASNLYDIFDVWVVHKVDFLEIVDANTIKISCSSVETDEVFESLKFDSSFYVVEDSTESRNGERVLKFVPAYGSRYEDSTTLPICVGVLAYGTPGAKIDKGFLEGTGISSFGDMTIKPLNALNLFGHFDGATAVGFVSTLRFDVMYDDTDDCIFDLHGYFINQLFYCSTCQSIKGGIVIPFLGTTGDVSFDRAYDGFSMKVDKNKTPFFITLAAPSIPLNVGPFLITLSVEPNIVFCAYAELTAPIYNSTLLKKKFVKEFGLHFNKDDNNDRYFHPKEGKEAAEKDEETVQVGEGFDNLKFGIQTVLSCPVTATLQNTISLSVGPTFEPTFEVTFPLKGKKKDLYQIEDKYLYENEGYEMSFSMPFSITAKGTIGFKKWMSADLFTLTIKLPSVTPIVSDLIDSYSISSIKEDKEKTTYSEVAYRAKIDSDYGLISYDDVVSLAIFDNNCKFVKKVEATKSGYSSYECEFTLPIEYNDKGLVSKTSYTAFALRKMPFKNEYLASDVYSFNLGGDWAVLSKCSQVDTQNCKPRKVNPYDYSDDPELEYCYAFKFTADRHTNFDSTFYVQFDLYLESGELFYSGKPIKVVSSWKDNRLNFLGYLYLPIWDYFVKVTMFYEDNETGEMFFLAEKNISLKKDYSSSEKFNPDDAANMKYWEKKGYTVVN